MSNQTAKGPDPPRSPVLVVPFPPGAILDNLVFSSERSDPTCSFKDKEIRPRERQGLSHSCGVQRLRL